MEARPASEMSEPVRISLTDVGPVHADDRPDAPLGTLLFRAGLVPEDELRDALESSISEGRRLGEVLLERKLIGERDFARILAGQKGLPFIDLEQVGIDLAAVGLLSHEQACGWGALPVALEGDVPVVAVSDPANRHLFGLIADELGRKPRFVVVMSSQLAAAIGTAFALLEYRGHGAEVSGTFVPISRTPERDGSPPLLRVLALLVNGERIEVASAPDPAGALVEARSFILGLDERRPGEWPFASGRFLRPDAIVSIEVAETSD
jgi:hypothetical protein